MDKDIELYVAHMLTTSKFTLFPQSLKELISSKLSQGSKGMFRWAKCQVDNLVKCTTARDIKTVLESLPSTLDETYYRMVQEIPQSHLEIARRALLWLMLNHRDLTLEELAEAVIIEPDVYEIDEDSKLLDPGVLLEILGSFVTLSRRGMVGLAHYSVKEYFMSDRAKLLRVDTVTAEVELGRYCLTYLLLDTLREGSDKERDIHLTLGTLPLINYAAGYWWKHARVDEKSLLDMILKFLDPNASQRFKTLRFIFLKKGLYYSQSYRSHNESNRKPGPLHAAAGFNLTESAEALCKAHEFDMNARAYTWGSPLYLAAGEGNEEMVAFLLANGANPNIGRGDHGTPLTAACIANKPSIVKRLVEAGADVNGKAIRSGYGFIHPYHGPFG